MPRSVGTASVISVRVHHPACRWGNCTMHGGVDFRETLTGEGFVFQQVAATQPLQSMRRRHGNRRPAGR